MRLDLDSLSGYDPTRIAGDPDEQAAVLAPVIAREDGDYLLFTERSPDLEQHAGEMSFPGGGRDPADTDLRETALREADEEIGLNPGEADVVGHLDDVPGPFGHVIRPYVGRVPDREYIPDGREIVETVVLSVDALTDPANYRSEVRDRPERGRVVIPYFEVDGALVWGLTGFMLSSLLELTTDWEPPAPE
ncbi:NUDIX hydrolase [Natronomonas sp. EA1]|uniref:NUDIX hydrolase n=1 Tax=Natronomonas sp. EA1 TaxID=3421655 RepID=UPI003EBC773D